MAKAVKVAIILMLVFISAAVLWFGLKAILDSGSSSVTIGKYNNDLMISQVNMMDYEDVNVKVKRTSFKNELEGVRFIVYDRENSQMTSYHISMDELEENNFQVVLSVENTSNIKKITISPIIIAKSGDQVIGNTQDEYKVDSKEVVVFDPPIEDTGYSDKTVKNCVTASDCKDDDPCTIGACFKGVCSYPKVPGCEFCRADSECDDENSCTENSCISERCSYTLIEGCESCAYDFQCEDNNACTFDACVAHGCVYTSFEGCIPCDLNGECTDNDPCTNDTCYFGKCHFTEISDCSPCTLDSECEDNNECTEDFCLNGGCVYNKTSGCSSCELDSQCDDKNACTNDTCSEGVCIYSQIEGCNYCTSSTQCDDTNPCTSDICLLNECTHKAKPECVLCSLDSECNDNNECTEDVCLNGACNHTKIEDCSFCTSIYQCEDNNPCTKNECLGNKCVFTGISGCNFCTLNTQCEDNNPCTYNNCTNSKCVYTPMEGCTDQPNSCTSVYHCEDNNPCTKNECSDGFCSYTLIENCVLCSSSSQCNDNIPCTANICSNGKCTYSQIKTCINGDGCCPGGCTSSQDSDCAYECGNNLREGNEQCDGTDLGGATCAGVGGLGYTGILKCSNCTLDKSSCVAPCVCLDDGNLCTTDYCDNSGVCQHSKVLNCCMKSSECDDNNPSTSNICSSANRCAYVPITECEDNDGYCPSGCNLVNDNNCAAVCGNGYRENNEGCDDGAKNSGDGCSSTCTVESGWTCNTATPNVCTKVSSSSLENGLVSWWKLDGNIIDSSKAYSATNNGVTFQTTGCVSEGCGIFDGVGDYIQISSSSDFNTGSDLTLSAWIYWKGTGGEQNVITKEGSYEIRVASGEVNYATNPWEWRGDNAMVNPNIWAHVVVTHDGNGLQRIYINGVSKYSTSSGGDIVSNTNPITIGRRLSGTAYFNGLIDDVRIWNRALNISEIQSLFNSYDYIPEAPSCTNDCSANERTCASSTQFRTCGNYDDDSCLDWSPATSCSNTLVCSGGNCIASTPSCTNDCTLGARECYSTGYRTCGNHDSDTCTEWSSVTSCAYGCTGGYCNSAPSPSCTDDCADGARECYGTGYRTCGDTDSDVCNEWNSVVACAYGCTGGYCNSAPSPTTGKIIIDHRTTSIGSVSSSCINTIKSNLHIAYSHTSHGNQIIEGMDMLKAWNSAYSYSFSGGSGVLHFEDYYGYGDDSGFATGGCYDLSNCDSYSDGLLGPTREYLDNAGRDINVIMWSWCSIYGHDIAQYLDNMKTIITEYPDVKFVFITGHTEGATNNANVDYRNNLIRDFVNNDAFCNTHQCILFDFADIEEHNPNGEDFMSRGINQDLSYTGGNWGTNYMSSNSNTHTTLGALQRNYGCSHSNSVPGAYLNCALKGEAVWNLFGKIAGCA
jgi:hypothetical protein